MMNESLKNKQGYETRYRVLVAVDFSENSARALRAAKSIIGRKPDQIIVLHVIDEDFVNKCIDTQIGTEADIKKALFLQAKTKLKDFLHAADMADEPVDALVCQGIPFLEINNKAAETGVDMVIMGNRGNSGDMQTIFFGSTTERVLRFMRCPVLCIPTEEDRK